MQRQIKTSVTVAGHRTSISLELPFLEAMKEIDQIIDKFKPVESSGPKPATFEQIEGFLKCYDIE